MLYWDSESKLTLKYFIIYRDNDGPREEFKGQLTNITNAVIDEKIKNRFKITGQENEKQTILICDAFTFKDDKMQKSNDKAQEWVNKINSKLEEKREQKSANETQQADQAQQAQESADQADQANQSKPKEEAKANEQEQTGGLISLFQKSKIKKHKISYSNI